MGNPDVWPGRHTPLGATVEADGTNFAVWAPDATGVELCLFADDGSETRLPLTDQTVGVWHGLVPGIGDSQCYGFRADGPWDPAHGHRFNRAKLLLDPYARAVDGTLTYAEEVFAARPDDASHRDERDSAPYVPRSVVVGPGAIDRESDWQADRPLHRPWSYTVIAELHVKGFTAQHPDVPEELRGTYAGLAHPRVTRYLTDLGVTAVELLPVHHFVSEPHVVQRGLTNFWGYNSIGFFAPHAAYSAAGSRGEQVREFKQMVRDLHATGLEVILDVVYNHTAEGGVDGPALSFRGYDDGAYYRQHADGSYADVTGCGNTVDANQPQALRLIMDSLRYWVTEMHVDGFRFDLASALGRADDHVDLRGPFFAAVGQDPVLREVKLIAEPWDVRGDGYQVGAFPSPWCEWNDKFRDSVRDFWRGQGSVSHLASRLSGSADLYYDDGRHPLASINFVTAHDGFTLRDLTTYAGKHNEANQEGNRDGTNDNRSWNCGVEGETDDPEINRLRRRQAANLMTTLLLSTGVPMMLAGDERGRTQRGNNNAYSQDNETSWVDWSDAGAWSELHALTRRLLHLRAEHPVLRQRHFFAGRPLAEGGGKDLTWLHPDGHEMAEGDWHDASLGTVGFLLNGEAIRHRGRRGEPIRDTSFLVWLHAGAADRVVRLPDVGTGYAEVLRTDGCPTAQTHRPGAAVTMTGRSVLMLELV
ncbi:MAG TPA: glycogen debranching protein GlgX [Nocardioidaceae bacterium]|nr:glycogen debranching protein GlgX [Nocardioidaceae bacterium]